MILLSQSILSNPTLWYESGASEYQDDAIAQVDPNIPQETLALICAIFFKDYCSPLFLFSLILLSQSILTNPTLWYESGASEYLDDASAQIRHPHSTRNIGSNLCYFLKIIVQDDAFAQVQHPHSTRNVGYNMCYFFKDYCSPLFLFSLIGVGMKLVIVNH